MIFLVCLMLLQARRKHGGCNRQLHQFHPTQTTHITWQLEALQVTTVYRYPAVVEHTAMMAGSLPQAVKSTCVWKYPSHAEHEVTQWNPTVLHQNRRRCSREQVLLGTKSSVTHLVLHKCLRTIFIRKVLRVLFHRTYQWMMRQRVYCLEDRPLNIPSLTVLR